MQKENHQTEHLDSSEEKFDLLLNDDALEEFKEMDY